MVAEKILEKTEKDLPSGRILWYFSFVAEMLPFSASNISSVPVSVPVKTRGQCKGQIKQTGQGPLGLATQLQPIDRIKPFVHSSRKRSASIICSAAMVSLLLDLLLHVMHVLYFECRKF
ncbi:PREDICTED: uncharacterized protein LOC105118841 [Populus euphratica]|uniref:Uncharacterized protein LOC105118841 n=1 Tax=Populus euphratica TaxID=75702 RepID=A0AAJ6TQE3_POPEU|nr:PREDICTED: uncharacterized protein LOC105118841 [Populus euphratica]